MPKLDWRFQVLFGFVLGGVLLWLLLREISFDAVRAAIAAADMGTILCALLVYACALAVRSLRWSVLLAQLRPVRYEKVALVLVVGYAVNNLLPARLGELLRADLAKSRLGVSRTASLATIAIERTIDGLVVVLMLAVSLAVSPLAPRHQDLFLYVLAVATILFGVLVALLLVFARFQDSRLLKMWSLLSRVSEQFGDGLRTLNLRTILLMLALTLGVWILDGTNLWLLMRAVGVSATLFQVMLVTAIVSLSMLLPTAPGYLGTLQYAFVIGVGAFGFSQTQGFAAATALQVFILGPATLVGVMLMLLNHISITIRSLKNADAD